MYQKAYGFIGLGIMGKGMLTNLIKKTEDENIKFYVWNRTTSIVEEFFLLYPNKNIISCSTPGEVIKNSDITYTMLSNEEASLATYEAEGFSHDYGILANISEGKSVIDCATLSPERMAFLGKEIQERGGKFLEAPVSGSKGPAEQGALIFICSGNKELFESEKPNLSKMGKASFFFDNSSNALAGKGSQVKILVNMLMITMMSSFTETLQLAKSLDISEQDLLQIIDLGAISTPMYKLKGPLILSDNFTTNFPLKHALKDIRLASLLASSVSLSLPTVEASLSEFEEAQNEIEKKEKDDVSKEEIKNSQDFSAIYRTLPKILKRKFNESEEKKNKITKL